MVFVGMSVLGVTGYAYWKVNNVIENTTESLIEDLPGNAEGQTKDNGEKELKLEDQSFAILLLGEDYRKETGSRNTDAIIVGIVNPVTKDIKMLSIPRDTKVNIPDHGYGKVNGVFSLGEKERREQEKMGETPTTSGPHMLMKILSDFLDLPIKYYAKVDFSGFELVVNELDGIEIDVERNMYYISEADGTNINLKKGLQILNGKQALDYARFRRSSYGNDSSDFERNIRHQKIIKALVDELSSFTGVINVFDILEIAGDHIKTNLTSDEIKALLWEYKSIRTGNIQTIEMKSYWENPYVHVDQEELLRVQNELKKALETINY